MEFNEVYSNYKDFVYNVVCKILRYDTEEIEDICQDVWIRIFRKLDQFDESKGVIEGWLYRITSNQVFKYFKKNKDCKEVNRLESDFFDLLSSDRINYSEAFKGEKERLEKQKIELIKKESSKLGKGQKEIFNLYYFEGLKHEEIAEIKGLSCNTSKSQLMRAKARIKELIK